MFRLSCNWWKTLRGNNYNLVFVDSRNVGYRIYGLNSQLWSSNQAYDEEVLKLMKFL